MLLLFLSIPLFTFFFNGIDKSDGMVDDTSLKCSFNRGNTEGTNSSKISFGCLHMYVLFYVCVRICFAG